MTPTKTWSREASLDLPPHGRRQEIWRLRENGEALAEYPVEVTLGKYLDVMRLRGRTPDWLRERAAYVRDIAARLYAPEVPRNTIERCPCCDLDAAQAEEAFAIYGVSYRRCGRCGHTFVGVQPAQHVLNELYATEDDFSTGYTDRKSLEFRLNEIIRPKLDWVLNAYRTAYGRDARSVVDVGAGGGHFVAACERAGLQAVGYEINAAAARFAEDAFGVALRNEDYLTQSLNEGAHDIVSFWGLLEYTPNPGEFVRAASRQLSPENGMLILEVPRVDCFCTAVQQQYPTQIWRHAVPTSHVNLFSDASVASILHENGFRPVSAWYFGMDVYELFSLLSVDIGDDGLLGRVERLLPPLQAFLDTAVLSDDLIVAAVRQS